MISLGLIFLVLAPYLRSGRGADRNIVEPKRLHSSACGGGHNGRLALSTAGAPPVDTAIDKKALSRKKRSAQPLWNGWLPCPNVNVRCWRDWLQERQTRSLLSTMTSAPRTVEIYRANVMTKMQASSLSELVRIALIAGILDDGSEPKTS